MHINAETHTSTGADIDLIKFIWIIALSSKAEDI